MFKRFLAENPTLIVTVSYLLITIIGVLYSYFFYQEFGVNVLKFADLSDFLLISILEPRSVVVFIGIVIFTFTVVQYDFAMRRRFKGYGDFVNRKLKPKYSDPAAVILLLIIFTPIMLQSLAHYNAIDVKSGEADIYEVRLSDTGERPATQNLVVLGTSSRYGYFYQPENQSAFVVPLENISYMNKVVEVTKAE